MPSACSPSSESEKRPNIIIIYADDLGYGDLGTYGGDIPSPNIQRIADAGIKFTDFYVSAPVCTPSRYSLLTGNYPNRSLQNLTGALMPEHTGHIEPSEKLMPAYLKEFGYRTALFGKWHLGNSKPEYFPHYHGFDTFVGHTHGCIDFFTHVYGSLGHDWFRNSEPLYEEGFATDLITNHSIEFISVKDDKPFFMFVSYNAPHYGKSYPAEMPDNTIILSEGVRMGVEFANTLQAPAEDLERFAHLDDIYRQYYSAMVANMDDNIGRLLDFLEDSGQMENTIIWFISDNGGYSINYFAHADNGPLKGEKGQIREGGIRIPTTLCWKGSIKPGQVIDQPSANIDILPTLLDILMPDHSGGNEFDGISLLPVLLNNEELERDIFWQYRNERAYRRGDWKLFGDELYNLRKDIGEENNLAGSYPDIFNELVKAHQNKLNSILAEK